MRTLVYDPSSMDQASTLADDRALLGRFTRNQDEGAFRALVERYSDMVYSVCLRILGDSHEAEDAAQAVFLVLFRKAAGLSSGSVLAGWLYRASELTAREASRNRSIRLLREMEARTMASQENVPPALDTVTETESWRMLRKVLDAELAALPSRQRDAIVLRYFRGLSLVEASREARCPEGTLSARLTRGLERLRTRLDKRGMRMSAIPLSALILTKGVQAAPRSFSASIQAVCLGKAGVSQVVAHLAKEVAKAMLYAKMKIVFAVALVLGLLGIPLAGVALRAGEPETRTHEQRPAAPSAEPIAPAAGSADKTDVPPCPEWVKLSREIFLRLDDKGAAVLDFRVTFKNPGDTPMKSLTVPNTGMLDIEYVRIVDGKGRKVEVKKGDVISEDAKPARQDVTYTVAEEVQPGMSITCIATLRLKSGLMTKEMGKGIWLAGFSNQFNLFQNQTTLGRLVLQLPKGATILEPAPEPKETFEKDSLDYVVWEAEGGAIQFYVLYTLPGADPNEAAKIAETLKVKLNGAKRPEAAPEKNEDF